MKAQGGSKKLSVKRMAADFASAFGFAGTHWNKAHKIVVESYFESIFQL